MCVKKLYCESVGYNKFKISLYKFMHGEGDVLYSMATCILERGDGKVQLVVCVNENSIYIKRRNKHYKEKCKWKKVYVLKGMQSRLAIYSIGDMHARA